MPVRFRLERQANGHLTIVMDPERAPDLPQFQKDFLQLDPLGTTGEAVIREVVDRMNAVLHAVTCTQEHP